MITFIERISKLEQEEYWCFNRIEELKINREKYRKNLMEILNRPINDAHDANNIINQLEETDKEISKLREELGQLKENILKLRDFPLDMYNFINTIINEDDDDINWNKMKKLLNNWWLKGKILERYWNEINQKYWGQVEIPETIADWKNLLIPFEMSDDELIEFLMLWEIKFDWRDFLWEWYKNLIEDKYNIIDTAIKKVFRNLWHGYTQTRKKLKLTNDEQKIKLLNSQLDKTKKRIIENIEREINKAWYNKVFEQIQNYKINTIKNYFPHLIEFYKNHLEDSSNDEVTQYLNEYLNWKRN